MLEKEILQNEELWDDFAFLSMLEERTVDYEKDRTNMSTWEEVKAKVARLKD